MDALLELWQTWHMFMKHTKILAILYSEAYKRGKVPIAFYKSIMPQADLFKEIFGEDKTIEAKLAALANPPLSICGAFRAVPENVSR